MTKGQAGLKLNFSSSPTVAKFFNSKGFVRGLMGPVLVSLMRAALRYFAVLWSKSLVPGMELSIRGGQLCEIRTRCCERLRLKPG